MTSFIGIIENHNMIKAYAWFSYIKREKIYLYGENHLRLKTFLKKNIVFEKDIIGTYHGKWHEIQRHMVCDSNYLDKLMIESNAVLKFQRNIFKSPKAINYFKQYFSDIEYKLIRDKEHAKQSFKSFCFLLPRLHSYKILAKNYLNESEYTFSWILTLFFILYGIKEFARSFVKMLLVKPVFVKKQKGLVLKKPTWGFSGKGLRDDMLVDEKKILSKDMIYYYERNSVKKNESLLIDEIKRRKYNLIEISSNFNLNICLLNHLKNNVIFGIISFCGLVIYSPFIMYSLISYYNKSFNAHKLLSFCDVKYIFSVADWHDIVETVVANYFGVKMFLYPWTDGAQCYYYKHAYCVHNDLFLWGPIESKYFFQKSLHDRTLSIGCIFSNSFIEKKKETVFKQLGLTISKKLITFYDSPVNNQERFPQSLFDQFRKIILLVDQKYSNVQIVLKPKTVTDEYREYFRGSSVKLLDGNDIYLGDIINISTLNIGMGIVAPVTVSLIMNKPGIFFDTAGNYNSPFANYEGKLVFRDQESLLNKIDQILTGQFSPIIIDELKDYNVPGSNPVEILREYVTTGKVDDKYRLHTYS